MVFDDADVGQRRRQLIGAFKYRNAGQVCVSPTRFFVQEKVYDTLRRQASPRSPRRIKVGDGLEADTHDGAARPIRAGVDAMRGVRRRRAGARAPRSSAGGKRIGNQGNFFEPTGADRRAGRTPAS